MIKEPGVYRSDVDGHFFILKRNPIAVTCVICMESCIRRDFKDFPSFKTAALTFVDKHGALDERIADNLTQLIPPRPSK